MSVIPMPLLLLLLLVVVVVITLLLGCCYHFHHHHLFMQAIYTCIPETNYVTREQCRSCSVVTIHGAYTVSFSVESVVFLH
jgi:hypothetical protein